jgi:DNA (cytosine-5)-methyltransferase 1
MGDSVLFGDLFAGAGGFSVGLREAGLADAYALESDTWACDTLRENFGGIVLERDIRNISDEEIAELPRPQIIVGGPPCQGFSVAGPSQYGVEDPRNNLFMHFLRFVEIQLPDVCIIENVPQLLTKQIAHGVTASDVIRDHFFKLGYVTQTFLLNAVNFGVPQSRKRAFVVATHPKIRFVQPHATHALSSGNLTLFSHEEKRVVSVWDAISDLPEIDAGEGTDSLVAYPGKALSDYQRAMRRGARGVMNHIAMKHTQRLIERFKKIAHGKSLKDVASTHGQFKYRSGEVNDRPYKSNNQRLNPEVPSLAIPASFQSTFLHPFRHRNLTAREAARLMSFPDRFVFRGKRTAMSWEKHLSQYNQIGNAVCPLVSEALGRACLATVNSAVGKSQFELDSERAIRITVPVHDSSLSTDRLIPAESKILDDLARESLKLLMNDSEHDGRDIVHSGFRIPAFYLACAILFATESDCLVCRADLPPHRKHSGEIPFLISKDDLSSLLANEKDHGLDYHLRALDSGTHQVGHFVGEILEGLGLARAVTVQNSRTGRNVRGLQIENVPPSIEQLRTPLRECVVENQKALVGST